MSVEVIKKLRELVRSGATIIGAPPEKATGLKDYPSSDAEVRSIAAEIWGDLDGINRTERRFGKGRVIWGKSPREVLLADGIKPDFTYPGQAEHPNDFDYIHRTSGDAEIYYVINRDGRSTTQNFTFRVCGKQPEIWDPVSGSIRQANAFRQADGFTTLPLELDRYGSYFVVFRRSIDPGIEGQAQSNSTRLVQVQNLSGPWKVEFDPAWGGPTNAEFPTLVSWTQRPEEGIKFYSGKATYRKAFDLKEAAIIETNRASKQIFLEFANVKEVATVRLNGQNLGVLWCFPWRIDITKAVKPAGNVLEVDVINLWPNRVIGDLGQPKEKRFTKTHDVFRFDMLTKTTPLVDSGLLGTVSVLEAQDDLGDE